MGSSGDVDLLRFVADEGDVQFASSGALSEKCPEASVVEPIVVPSTRTVAPTTGARPDRHRARHLLVLCRDGRVETENSD